MYLNFANKVIGIPKNTTVSQENHNLDMLDESLEDLYTSLEQAQDFRRLVSGHEIKTPLEKKLVQVELNKITQGNLGVSLESFGDVNVSLEFIGKVVNRIWEGILWVFRKITNYIKSIFEGKTEEELARSILITNVLVKDKELAKKCLAWLIKNQKKTLKWFDKAVLKNGNPKNVVWTIDAFIEVSENTKHLIESQMEILDIFKEGFLKTFSFAELKKTRESADFLVNKIFESLDASFKGLFPLKDKRDANDYDLVIPFFGMNLYRSRPRKEGSKAMDELKAIYEKYGFNFIDANVSTPLVVDYEWKKPEVFEDAQLTEVNEKDVNGFITTKSGTIFERLRDLFELIKKENKSIVLTSEKLQKEIHQLAKKELNGIEDKDVYSFNAELCRFYSKLVSNLLGSGYIQVLAKTKEVWTTIGKFDVPELDK